MLILISFPFLDLRFFITRALGENTRERWLQPRWLQKSSGCTGLGRLGAVSPMPGRPRTLPAYESANAHGGTMLQTPEEAANQQFDAAAEYAGFAILNREFAADLSGQLRFELLLEKAVAAAGIADMLRDLLNLAFTWPYGGDTVCLAEASGLIAGVYESESNKTIADPALRAEALQAAAGTVIAACNCPSIVLMDIDGELDTGAQPAIATSNSAMAIELRMLYARFGEYGADVWHMKPAARAATRPDNQDQLWSAAYDLMCLTSRVHELTAFTAEPRDAIKPDAARNLVTTRMRLFYPVAFGIWPREKIMAAAASAAWTSDGEQEAIVAKLESFSYNQRDAAGLMGGIRSARPVIIDNRRIFMTNNTFSGNFSNTILNVDSTLTNVSQGIGQIPNADPATKEELAKLVLSLRDALKTVPQEHAQNAEAIAALTDDLVTKAKAPAPNKTLIDIAIGGLKRAAETVKQAVPAVVTIVGGIASLIAKLHGIPLP